MSYHTAICLLILSMLPGCTMREECDQIETREKISLRWSYGQETDSDLLKKEIQQATVYLFSQSDHFIKSWTIPKNELFSPECRTLELSPGKYTIIVWANLLERTIVIPQAPNLSALPADFKILLKDLPGEADYPSSDSLFHGQTTIDVPDGENPCYTLAFRRECCYFKIYMEGFSRVPQIKIQGMPGGYDLEGNLLPVRVTLTPDIAYHETWSTYEANLATLRPAISDQLYLELYEKGTAVPVYTLNLNDVFRELCIDPQKDDEVNILIRLKALEGNRLAITVNNWHIIENINVNM